MSVLRSSAALAMTAVCLTLVACGDQPAGEPVVRTKLDEEPVDIAPPPLAEPSPIALPEEPLRASVCTDLMFEDAALTHCVADPAEHRIAVTYGPGDGSTPFGTLRDFAATIEDSATIAFAMNGGAFSDDLSARGYLVAGGARLSELNRADGEGNFFLKPSGVFFGTGGTWRVLTTDRFYSSVRDRPQFGTQSGPMLLVDGALHPQIAENGPSRAIRNGVGVAADGKAHFVISSSPLSFGQLARYFRDELEISDALFLDSNSSSLWDPAKGRMDAGRTGPIIVVRQREGASQ